MVLRYLTLLLASLSVQAAEIRGQVQLLAADGYRVSPLARSEIYVALLPKAGLPVATSRQHSVSLSRAGMNLRYLVINLGDNLKIEKRFSGSVRMKLFGNQFGRKLSFGQAPVLVVAMPERVGRYYLVNMVDNRQLLIVDVINSYRIVNIRSKRFEINRIESGTWKIRFYSAITRPRSVEVDAYTAPVEKQYRLYFLPEVLVKAGLSGRQAESRELFLK